MTRSLDLVLFTSDARVGLRARDAGIGTFIVDWEWRDKCLRQAGFDTQVNHDTPEQLAEMARIPRARVWCRIDAWGRAAEREVDVAVERGASLLLLPMVQGPAEVEQFLRRVDGRCRAGILVETAEACAERRALAGFPLDAVYVGLNDLSISRGYRSIFTPFRDGTIDALRAAFPEVPFGFGGMTVVGGGSPLSSALLHAEMARLDCAFTFLRRSFFRDIEGRDLAAEVARLRERWEELRRRAPEQMEADCARLRAAVAALEEGR